MSELTAFVVGVWLAVAVAMAFEGAGLDLSRQVVRAWVWAYTALVPAAERDRRREEMAEHLSTERGERELADVYEQPQVSPLARGVRTIWRLLKGTWSDLAWAVPLLLVQLAGVFLRRPRPPGTPGSA